MIGQEAEGQARTPFGAPGVEALPDPSGGVDKISRVESAGRRHIDG
jgi:hypothetical protein